MSVFFVVAIVYLLFLCLGIAFAVAVIRWIWRKGSK